MNTKTFIWFGLFVGSTVGAYIPNLWGAGLLSFSSIIFSMLAGIAGIAGIWAGFKVGQWF